MTTTDTSHLSLVPVPDAHEKELTPDDVRLGYYDGPNKAAVADARKIDLPTGSVGLIVTSPPTVNELAEIDDVGKAGAWGNYRSFLQTVCNEMWRVLEPGGRFALVINPTAESPHLPVAPYSVNALQIAGFTIRGEVVWAKSDIPLPLNAGVLRGPHNPPIVGVTERIITASKLTDHRRASPSERRVVGMPSENGISPEQWAANRLDIWTIAAPPPGELIHDAPFPVELASRLIQTHTYDGELVCDSMCGTGTTAIAAARLGRRYVISDIDPHQVDLAQQRLKAHAHNERPSETITETTRRHPSATTQPDPDDFNQLGLDFT